MRSILFYFFILFQFSLFSQIELIEVEEEPEIDMRDTPLHFAVVETVPVAPGCEDLNRYASEESRTCFKEYVSNHIITNFHPPKEASAYNVQGKSWVEFIIEKDGTVGSVEIVRSASSYLKEADENKLKAAKLLDEQAIRVVRSLIFLNPATQRGKPVRVYYTVPFEIMPLYISTINFRGSSHSLLIS